MRFWQPNVSEVRRPSLPVAAGLAAAMVAAMAAIRLGWAGQFPLPIGYGVPVVVMGLLRNRRLLWITVAAFAVLTYIKFFIILPEKPISVSMGKPQYDWLEGGLVLLDLLLVGGVVDIWIAGGERLESRQRQLLDTNAELAAREEEIARQNEELQSQTEELERQSEELRTTNEELAHREQALEVLLSLSRSLSSGLPRDQIMSRICQTLGHLISGPNTASAILEHADGKLLVRCHNGFGEGGLQETALAFDKSFSSVVLAQARTAYVEDLTLRPDFELPRPKDGRRHVAILATPLHMRAMPAGSLEVYHQEKTAWTPAQVSLIESLAAQASVSLEAAQLFETITDERNRFEAVLRTTPVGIAVCNRECTGIRLNPAGAQMLNVPPDVPLSTQAGVDSWRGYRNGRAMEPDEYPVLRAARLGEEVSGEEIEIAPAGSNRRINVLTYARPIHDAQNKLQGGIAVFVDITAQKELQRELDIRRREAEEASIRKTRFLAAVSHDIRTPANAISLLAELIRRTATNPEQSGDVPDLAQELHGSAVSLVNLLSDVLDIARFDSDKVELQETDFRLDELLADQNQQLLPLAREKGLSLQFKEITEPLTLRADRIKLSRILSNLVGNAIKFTDSGSVQVDAQVIDRAVQISVTDTGIGIPAQHLSHIFDEFFQLRNPERDRTKGTGLGLAICKRLVDAMGGQLDVTSQPGQGSTFKVTLPILPAATNIPVPSLAG